MSTKPETALRVKTNARLFLQQTRLAKWSGKAHVAFLLLQIEDVIEPLDDDTRAALIERLEFQGLGGNASQFRQYLIREGVLGKAEAQTEPEAILDRYADLIGAPEKPKAQEGPPKAA